MLPTSDPDTSDPAHQSQDASLLDACAAELAAWSDLFAACPGKLRERLGLTVEARGAFVALRAPGVRSLLFNRVFTLADPEPRASDLKHLSDGFARVGVRHFLVHVPQFAATARPVAEQQGLVPFSRNWVKFVRGAAPVQPGASDLEVEPATNETARGLAEVVCAGLDVPREAEPVLAKAAARQRWRAFVARDAGEVVAGGLAFLHDGYCHLLGSATRPSHRRRGAQNALLAARLQAGQDAGCHHADTETGELREDEPNQSFRNILRAGFREVGLIENLAPPGTKWT